MNKKTYNTPNTEVTRVEIQTFIAASDPKNVITPGSINADPNDPDTGTMDGSSAMSDININDVWE